MESRREFLVKCAEVGGGLAIVGILTGSQFYRQASARDQLRRQFVDDSIPLLMNKASDELGQLPSRCREEIRTYFHGVCLNVSGFVDEICSARFGEKLKACHSSNDQHELLAVTFSQKVVTYSEVMARVETIAQEAGSVLDQNWSRCCKVLTQSWRAALSQHGSPDLNLHQMVEPYILQSLDDARQTTYPLGNRPALSTVGKEIGRAAILLLPVAGISTAIAAPIFVVTALKSIFDYVVGQLTQRAENYQLAISERLAILGNRVGSEFETEIKKRIADLHHWQSQAIEAAAAKKANETIPSFL